MPLLFLLLLFLLQSFNATCKEEPKTVTLLTDVGHLMVLRKVGASKFLLQPFAKVEAAQNCAFCPDKQSVILTLRFWDRKRLDQARDLLQAQGWCKPRDPCHVSPFRARRIILRDPLGQWETLTSHIPLPDVLPPTKRVTIVPTKKAANSTSLSLGALTIFQLTIVSSALEDSQDLSITGEDLLLAQQLLKLPDVSSGTLIDRATLRRLASTILKAKNQDFQAAALSTSLLPTIEQNIATSVVFRPGMESLLARGCRAKIGDELFVRRKISPNEKVFVFSDPLRRSSFLTMELEVAENFKRYSLQRGKKAESAVEMLKRLDEEMKRVLEKVNRSEAQRQRLQTCDVIQLRDQLERLATATGSSHILDPGTRNLTAIDDCLDVKRRNMKDGVYFLRSLNRAVLCTSEGDFVVLERGKGDVSFNASWSEYEQGLGEAGYSDYFIGLKDLSTLTQSNDMCMTLLVTPWGLSSSKKRANYDSFKVASSEDRYRLSYQAYKGNTVFDILAVMNGHRFSTFDNDNDQFVGNCARRFNAGNWYSSCFKGNIFGPISHGASSGMCSVGVESSQGDMCSPLATVRMLIRKKSNKQGSRRLVFSTFTKSDPSKCKANLRIFTIESPGLYTVTVGGGGGGFATQSYNRYSRDTQSYSQPGGRGATVKAVFFFDNGTRLAASAGCRGASTQNGGYGGDASWLVSRSHRLLLAVAGGGGASKKLSSLYYSGLHGRAVPEGGDCWLDPGKDSPNAASILDPKQIGKPAKGWLDLRQRLLTKNAGDFSSGRKNYGGGGGGYEGGAWCDKGDNAGGGGGSFCDPKKAAACHVTEGGNTRPHGYVTIERNLCF